MDIVLVSADNGQDVEVGKVSVPLKMLESGEHKKTVNQMVIVADKFLEIKRMDDMQGLLRVILYLQDLGPATEADRSLSTKQQVASTSG